jgi:hypothetical protein
MCPHCSDQPGIVRDPPFTVMGNHNCFPLRIQSWLVSEERKQLLDASNLSLSFRHREAKAVGVYRAGGYDPELEHVLGNDAKQFSRSLFQGDCSLGCCVRRIRRAYVSEQNIGIEENQYG